MPKSPPFGLALGPETLNPLIQALTAAGENELAQRLAAHGAAKAQGKSTEVLARLWLD